MEIELRKDGDDVEEFLERVVKEREKWKIIKKGKKRVRRRWTPLTPFMPLSGHPSFSVFVSHFMAQHVHST